MAKRMTNEGGADLKLQVSRGIRLTTGRVPKADEIAKDIEFIEKMKAKHTLNDPQALQQYALLLLNSNEFAYVD